MDQNNLKFMKMAISLANNGMDNNDGGPFGAIVVKNGEIVGIGNNRVTSTNDPTAHAEIVAIRDACKNLETFQLVDCEIYTSCEPCPMCLSAIYWARPKAVYFGATKEDAASVGFDDAFIYEEVSLSHDERKIPMINIGRYEAIKIFDKWKLKSDKIKY